MSKPRILLTRRWTSQVEDHLAARFDVTLNEADVPLTATQLQAAKRLQARSGWGQWPSCARRLGLL